MLHKPLAPIEDDTEGAPWMVMGTSQYRAADILYNSLRLEMKRRGENVLVAAMLPIRFLPWPGADEKVLSPDVMVVPVASGDRPSYDLAQEGAPPVFVLEVISPESQSRDLTEKPGWYERMGVREYVLFAPDQPSGRRLMRPQLRGYRMDPPTDGYIPWEADATGRLYSAELQLWVAVHHGELRAQRPDGSWVPTLEESDDAREAAEKAHEAEARARDEAEARAKAAEARATAAEERSSALEAELAKLRDQQTRQENTDQ